MLSLPINHPDIEDFIDIKLDLTKITKANISVMISDDFMKAVKRREKYLCKFEVEANNELIVKEVDAYKLFMKLCKNNHRMGEPGMLFWDKITNYNFMSADKTFELAGTNPCGEEPLPAGGSCLLGSLNLAEFVISPFNKLAEFDFTKFKEAVHTAINALDVVLDEGLDLHPLEEQKESVAKYRQMGLGVMGIADMLLKLNMTYGSQESLDFCDKVAQCLLNEAVRTSALLAKENGPFPAYTEKVLESPLLKLVDEDVLLLVKRYGLRHSALLTIPPCGSISNLIGVSGGIEPIFALSYTRKTESIHGEDVYYKIVTPIAKQYMEKFNISTEEELPEMFVTANDIYYEDRIKMQAVWQKYIDASISSTVNLPSDSTIEDVAGVYMKAWEHGLKGITIFRDKCERAAILTHDEKEKKEVKKDEENIDEEIGKKYNCPQCGADMVKTGGCDLCLNCGWSKCN